MNILSLLTEKSRAILENACQKAQESGQLDRVGVEHLAAALLEEDVSQQILTGFSQNVYDDLSVAGKDVLGKNTSQKNTLTPSFHPSCLNALERAQVMMKRLNDRFIAQEALLLGVLDTWEAAHKILQKNRIAVSDVFKAIVSLRKGKTVQSEQEEESMDVLEKYGSDLTRMAKEGKLDPLIGREDEIRRAAQILLRRGKNNPVLIGEPGVGKTAIIEGLAQRIVEKDVPEQLHNKRIISLDLSSLVAGAKFRGEFEKRLQSVLDAVQKQCGNIILFIDEIHTLVGAGKVDGAMDAANMLKPLLARGNLRVIGATTLDEYREYIEKDGALTRRFQPIYVEAPSVDETVSILRGVKNRYELHHGVRVADDALIAASELSSQYITDRFLPDKAIDLIDEGCSRLRMQLDSKPEELDALERKIMQLNIEKEALKKEEDERSRERLQAILTEVEDLEKNAVDLREKWMSQKAKQNQYNEMQAHLEKHRQELQVAEREGNLSRAGELKYGIIPELEKSMATVKENKRGGLDETLVREHIAHIVSRWTGIPVGKLLPDEREKVLNVADTLQKRVIGQPNAVKVIAQCVLRARAGLQDARRPMGTYLFVGPTGVGKTELAKATAEFLFGDDRAFLRLDMSEYMEKHAVSRLVGAPPGYVGYDEGGKLTESVRRRPYQLILLDEIEKAHHDVFNIFLQVLDEGRLTDSRGRVVNFTNTLIIMTSNLGSSFLQEGSVHDHVIKEKLLDAVRKFLRPEFINRLDDIVFFDRLAFADMLQVVDIQVQYIECLLREKGMTLHLDSNAKDFLAQKGFSPEYGARPLKRAIRDFLQNPLSRLLLEGHITSGAHLKVTTEQEKLMLQEPIKQELNS